MDRRFIHISYVGPLCRELAGGKVCQCVSVSVEVCQCCELCEWWVAVVSGVEVLARQGLG